MGGKTMASEKGIEAKNKEAVQAGFHAWHEGSGSPFDLLIPEAKWTIVGNATVSKTYNGSQEFLELVVDPFNARMQRRLIPTVRGLYADGDMLVALFDAEAVANDGKPCRNTYTWYMTMRDGKIVD